MTMARTDSALPSPSRRAFRRGRARAETPLRSPWALAEGDFTNMCTACHACLSACPEQVLVRGSGGYPVFDPGRGECTFCGACEAACEPRAMRRDAGQALWTTAAHDPRASLPLHVLHCTSCSVSY